MAIVTRQEKGDLLTHQELDGNFTHLDSKISAEESVRIDADNALDTRVSTLESQPSYTPPTDQGADKFLSGDGNYKTINLSSKQDTLVSGTNIKTINGTSVLGSGDITIEASSGDALTSNDVVTSLYGATGDIDLDKPLFITSSPETSGLDVKTIPDNTEIKVIQTFRHDYAGTKYGGNFTYLTNSNKLYVDRGQYSAQLSYTPSDLFNLCVTRLGDSAEYVTFVISGQNKVDIYESYGRLKATLDLSQYYFKEGVIRSISATNILGNLYVVFCFTGKLVLYSGWDFSSLSFNSELSDPDNKTNGAFGLRSMFINDKFVVSNYNYNEDAGKIYVFNVGWSGLNYHTSLTSPSTRESNFGGDLLTDELETSLFVLGRHYIYKINPSTFQIVKQKKYTSDKVFSPDTVMQSYQPYCDGKNIFIASRFFNGETLMYDSDLNYIQTFSDDFVIGKNIIFTGLKTKNVKRMIYLVKEAKLGKPPVVTSPNGSQFKISVNDSGDITTSPYQPLIFNTLNSSYLTYHDISWGWEKTFSIDNTSMSGLEGNSLTSLDNVGLAIIVEIAYNYSFVVAFESKIISVDISAGVLNMNIPDEVVDMFNHYISVKGHTSSDGMSKTTNKFSFRIYEKVSNMEIYDTYNVGLIS